MLAGCDVISLIPIRDAERARRFYSDTLGLPFVSEDGFAVVFEVGGRTLRLTKVEAFTPQPFSIIGWRVADIATTVQGLADRGVTFERYAALAQDDLGIWAVPDGSARVAWFEDPDGNLLSIVETTR